MSLTINDLPAILADLARLEPERFRASDYAPEPWDVWLGDFWSPVSRSLRVADLITVQAAVQEAIVARGWDFTLDLTCWEAPEPGHEVTAKVMNRKDYEATADLPAIAISGAYRDALLALQEPA